MGKVETKKMKKRDFDWMIHLCEPTPSQDEALLHCPFARESEVFDDPISSSLGPTQPDPNQILMLSVPESIKPATAEEEDDAVFVTPPEHHHLRSSSSSDQKKRVRVSQGGLGDEAESKKIRVSQVEDTLPVVETQPVDVGIRGNKNVVETEVVVLDGSHSDEEAVSLGEDSVGSGEIRGKEEHSQDTSLKGGLGRSRIELENVRLKRVEMGTESVVGVAEKVGNVIGNEKGSEDVNGGLGSNKIIEARAESVLGVGEKVANVVENGKVSKDGVNGDVRAVTSCNGFDVRAGTSCNGFDEIDKFLNTGSGDANKKQGRVNSGDGRKLPESMQGKEDDNVVEKKSDLSDLLKMLELVVGDGDVGSEEVDFLETAKKRGMVFPRPRWWHPDW